MRKKIFVYLPQDKPEAIEWKIWEVGYIWKAGVKKCWWGGKRGCKLADILSMEP